jgi:hypothetical protein
VTVEFTPRGYLEQVRSQINYGGSEVNKSGVYQQVPMHYRVPTPLEAVSDEFVTQTYPIFARDLLRAYQCM